MIECGIIERIENEKAWVMVVRGEHCEGCQACQAFGDNNARILVSNPQAAKPGDRVEIEIDPKQVVKHSAIVFLLPILCLIIGYFLGAKFLANFGLKAETAGIIGSLALMVICFVVIAFYDRLVAKKQENTARVIRIL